MNQEKAIESLTELFNLLLSIHTQILLGNRDNALKLCNLFHIKYLNFYDNLRAEKNVKGILEGDYEVIR